MDAVVEMPLLASVHDSEIFPVIVIEVPKPSYYRQSKTAMGVASQKQGGSRYAGPMRLCLPRWKHIHKFYIIQLGPESYYLANDLTHHPHYSILQNELEDYEKAIQQFKNKQKKCQIIRVTISQNFKDDYLVVINDFSAYPELGRFVETIDDAPLLSTLAMEATLDTNRGNTKIDFGFASGQNLHRDQGDFGVTRPRILDRTDVPVFLNIQVQLSDILDIVCRSFGLPLFHRVDNIHKTFAQKLHPRGILPSWRAAFNGPNQYLEVHEDSNNDSRPLMSPVGVLSRIFILKDKSKVRLTKIGYSRQSLYDSIVRESLIKPIVIEFKEWEATVPLIYSSVSTGLFSLPRNSPIPGAIEFPCHLERSVGISPYVHATVSLQKLLSLSRHHCTGLLYNCVTNESPFFFYSVFEDIVLMSTKEQEFLKKMSPVTLGVWFHSSIWNKIIEKSEDAQSSALPRRHQPHNGKRTTDTNVSMSIVNLIKLVEQYTFLDGNESKKQFYHSKAIAILMKSPKTGGCHACGGLTSQTLLYALACVGLIPPVASRWGELAATDTAEFLEDHFQLSYSHGRAEQFLSCCVAASPGSTPEREENRVCKWTREKKRLMRKTSSNSEADNTAPFRDVIFKGQNLYHPSDGKIHVYHLGGHRCIDPPAYQWPYIRAKRQIGDDDFWEQSTRTSSKIVLGNNRRKKRNRSSDVKTLTVKQLKILLPGHLEIVFQAFCPPLFLSLNNLLGCVLNEPQAVPNNRMFARNRRRKTGFHFEVQPSGDNDNSIPFLGRRFQNRHQCLTEGSLLFCANKDVISSSKFIGRLLQKNNAKRQTDVRAGNPSGEYFLLHNNNGRTKSKRSVIAVVKQITSSRYVVALVNETYGTETMDYFYIDV